MHNAERLTFLNSQIATCKFLLNTKPKIFEIWREKGRITAERRPLRNNIQHGMSNFQLYLVIDYWILVIDYSAFIVKDELAEFRTKDLTLNAFLFSAFHLPISKS
jgi:hypothetical protein